MQMNGIDLKMVRRKIVMFVKIKLLKLLLFLAEDL